jgi:hypothetical protein
MSAISPLAGVERTSITWAESGAVAPDRTHGLAEIRLSGFMEISGR